MTPSSLDALKIEAALGNDAINMAAALIVERNRRQAVFMRLVVQARNLATEFDGTGPNDTNPWMQLIEKLRDEYVNGGEK